jgi:hypothetical protein
MKVVRGGRPGLPETTWAISRITGQVLLAEIPLVRLARLSGLRDLKNSITLAQLPAVASLLTRYRLFQLQFKFLSTKDDV